MFSATYYIAITWRKSSEDGILLPRLSVSKAHHNSDIWDNLSS
jgi:hypothetical protein